jgi:eukaryotic-like serine/threonine-protein kinase
VASVADLLAGRYELGERLGSGGMGDVFRARDALLERLVAVKIPTNTLTPSSAERFKREARAAARLNHPHVVGVYDWGGGDAPFIVMEYVDGDSLRSLLHRRGTLAPAEVAGIGAQIADALAHAHHHGVVHRDVKPGNVLLTPAGDVKVTDFGIAQSATSEGLTEPGVVLGTVGYLSPEQVAGLPADERTDVYSLGVVLHELLTGSRPTGPEPAPRTDLERAVARARAADPSARYQRAAELRDDLRAVAAGGTLAVERLVAGDTLAAPPLTAPPFTAPPFTAPPLTGSPVTALVVDTATGAADPVPPTTAVTVVDPTAVMPVAPPPRRGGPVAAPPRTSGPEAKPARGLRPPRGRVTKPPRPVKPLKPPKAKRVSRAHGLRRWRPVHLVLLVAAAAVLVVAGALAYAKLTEHAPVVAVPGVVDRDVFSAAAALEQAGFDVQLTDAASPQPGGIVLTQHPATGSRLEQGSTVQLVVSRTRATVPDIVSLNVDAARVALARRGLLNLAVTDDYRTDVAPGTVTRTNPAAFATASKAATFEVFVARDPHVEVPNLVGLDQAAAIGRLQGLGLEVAISTATSRTAAAGIVVKTSSVGSMVLRGATITLTVSTGPRQVPVPTTVNSSRDDAVSELEDAGFVVVVTTTPVTSSSQDGLVVAQTPAGGNAAEGSTVTVTVGVRQSKGKG